MIHKDESGRWHIRLNFTLDMWTIVILGLFMLACKIFG